MFPNPSTANSSGGGTADPTQQQQLQQQQNMNYNGMQQQQQQQQQQPPPQQQQQTNKNLRKKPFVRITEQPAGKALRFRYECEGRSAGSIPGVNSTPETKTFPTIEIVGYKGRAVVVVSCVTKDKPYRPHPHNLVGKEGCKKGVCTLEINSETMRAVFSNLGIQCVKKKDIEAALKAREEIRVDPFKTGFSHRFQPSSIDLNAVRLCFQVFMECEQKGRFTQPLAPVVSEPIFDKKAMSDLVICRLCSCSATVLGNTQIILLCEKVAKEDISVRFFEEKNGQTVWEAFGEFQHTDVHKQTAIAFKTPRYHTLDITEPAKVLIQLRRPSDGVTSEALPFEYIPLDSDPATLRRKRQKLGGDPMHLVLQQQQKSHLNDLQDGRQMSAAACWNQPNIPAIKTEPRDTSPQRFAMYRAPPELTPSPQPLSPSNNYTHINNTPSPYNMAAAGTIQVPNNTQMVSPNRNQYAAAAACGGPGIPVGRLSAAPSAQDMNEYSPFTQQHQQHQQQQHQQQQHQQQQHQQQQQPQHQQQQHTPHQNLQQFHNNNAFVGVSEQANHWEGKFAAVAAVTTSHSHTMSNLTNPYTMDNLLAQASNPGTSHQQWNIAPSPMQQDIHMQQQHHQQSHHHPQSQYQHQTSHESANNNLAMGGSVTPVAANTATPSNVLSPNNSNNNDNPNTNTNTNDNGSTLSNLITLTSGQLLHMNSEDQQMLRLNSEDLQISNLSIST